MSLDGNLVIGLFDSTGIKKKLHFENVYQYKIAKVQNYTTTIIFDSVPYGNYAIKVLHDQNNNGRFEYFNEDFGYSINNLKKLNLLTIKNLSFAVDTADLQIKIHLQNPKMAKIKEYSTKFSWNPMVFYTPETSVMGGVNAVKTIKFSKNDTISRPSIFRLNAAFSFNKQFISNISYTIFTNEEKWIFVGNIGFQKFPQYYYGIGNTTPIANEELIAYNLFRLEHLILKKTYKKLFVGIGYKFQSVFNMKFEVNGELGSSKITGYNGSSTSGIQAAMMWDSRNHILTTTKGWYLLFKNTFYSKLFKSDFDYLICQIDARKFITPFAQRKDILALQLYSYLAFGNTPWIDKATLGNDMIMRGYYLGRYRDNILMAFQAEYRLNFNKTFGVVAFAGAGKVSNSLSTIDFNFIKPTFGVGGRVQLDRIEQLNLRFDLGFGVDTYNFYFTLGEAF